VLRIRKRFVESGAVAFIRQISFEIA
jgi:hypothetical protein